MNVYQAGDTILFKMHGDVEIIATVVEKFDFITTNFLTISKPLRLVPMQTQNGLEISTIPVSLGASDSDVIIPKEQLVAFMPTIGESMLKEYKQSTTNIQLLG